MLSSEVFRHAKPSIGDLTALVRRSSVNVITTPFANSMPMTPINRGLFDVIDANGILLNRAEGFQREYWFEDGLLRVNAPGTYTLRRFDNINAFEASVIVVGNKLVPSNGGAFSVKIPFWPQILSQPERGIARVANDGQNIAYVSQGFVGQDTFAYRMVNAYGQVSEPACINVTVVS